MALRIKCIPSVAMLAVALYVFASDPVMEYQAHWITGTPCNQLHNQHAAR